MTASLAPSQANDECGKLTSNSGRQSECLACGATNATVFCAIQNLPVHVGKCYLDQASALAAPRAKVELAYCHNCGHVFNRAFEAALVNYEPGYEVSLFHSPVFTRFMESVADRLVNQFQLQGKSILEIGSGRGWFLEKLCQLGGNHGIGVDPTIVDQQPRSLSSGSLRLIKSYFDEPLVHRNILPCPDFVCSLSVFEHVAQPRHLLKVLRQLLGTKPVAMYCEVFNAARAFRNKEIWSILYEQCSYFSTRSLSALFQCSGFSVVQAGCCYEDGQYLFVDAIHQTNGESQLQQAEPFDNGKLPGEIVEFSKNFDSTLELWRSRLSTLAAQEKRVVFWGSGGKGVSFLNLLPTRRLIEFVAEINPEKQGRFIPGAGQQIVSPHYLCNYRPDVVIISNAIYEQEIRQQAGSLGLECEFYVA